MGDKNQPLRRILYLCAGRECCKNNRLKIDLVGPTPLETLENRFGWSDPIGDPDKVMMHAMFGIITLFADQLLKVTGC